MIGAASAVPWWGWLIIAVIALGVITGAVIGGIVWREYRRSVRAIAAMHKPEPYTRRDASGSGPWPYV